tara:strand:- start:11774 stop:12412 length:639 start_codon:yes stop_codon:yes gene_type:complete
MDPFTMMKAGGAALGGIANIAGGLIGGRKRRQEQRAAQRELNQMKQQYSNLDTSNLMANLENTAEDLTVNQQASNFQAQQNQASQANIMQSMSGAAGGSGIAALAQSMANQASQQNQAAAADIGRQEASNQAAAAQQAASNQMAERQGAGAARSLQYEKTGTMLGMAQQRKGAADAAREAAKQQVIGGIGQVGGAVSGFGADMQAGLGSVEG